MEIARIPADHASYVDSSVAGGATYCYRVRAGNAAGYSDYSNIACGAPAAAAGSFADDFGRTDAGSLGNGWFSVSGTLMIQGEQARNAPARAMHTAVQPSLTGEIQDVSASFAPVNHNLGPRFSLLLRYRDAKNYYACDRQTGGISALRISKTVNGVETVLKALAIPNPIKGRFFALGCQAKGATLTLTFNGVVKLTASDPAFSTGSVGMAMGYPTPSPHPGASHRADNFKATVK